MSASSSVKRAETIAHLQSFVQLSPEEMANHLVGTHKCDAVGLPTSKVALVKEHARQHELPNDPSPAPAPAKPTPPAKAAPAKAAPAKAKAAPAPAPAPKAVGKTAREFVRELDKQILEAAGQIVDQAGIPAKLKGEVALLIANQLHHLSSPTAGWVGSLPKPQRSEWL